MARAGADDAATGTGHRPGRKAGALVVLVDGELVLYVERGGRTLLTFTDDDPTPLDARRSTRSPPPYARARSAGSPSSGPTASSILGSGDRAIALRGRWRRPASTPPRAGCGCAATEGGVPEGDTVWRTAHARSTRRWRARC